MNPGIVLMLIGLGGLILLVACLAYHSSYRRPR